MYASPKPQSPSGGAYAWERIHAWIHSHVVQGEGRVDVFRAMRASACMFEAVYAEHDLRLRALSGCIRFDGLL